MKVHRAMFGESKNPSSHFHARGRHSVGQKANSGLLNPEARPSVASSRLG
jgi:hypothetical protein